MPTPPLPRHDPAGESAARLHVIGFLLQCLKALQKASPSLNMQIQILHFQIDLQTQQRAEEQLEPRHRLLPRGRLPRRIR